MEYGQKIKSFSVDIEMYSITLYLIYFEQIATIVSL